MKLSEALQDLGRPVAYYPSLARLIGVKETIFFCQFYYWLGKERSQDGWIYKTQEEITEETGLSRTEQEVARKSLKRQRLLEEKFARLDHKMFYRPLVSRLDEIWEAQEKTRKSFSPERGKPASPNAGNLQPANAGNLQPVVLETCSGSRGTETTAESTSENTAESIYSPPEKISVEREKKRPNVTDEAARLAEMLRDSILSNYPSARPATESQLRQWALESDLLNRIDGKPWDQIEELLSWSQHDSFWKQNIQSGGKFREKWNQLLARAGTSGEVLRPRGQQAQPTFYNDG